MVCWREHVCLRGIVAVQLLACRSTSLVMPSFSLLQNIVNVLDKVCFTVKYKRFKNQLETKKNHL